MKVGIFGGTFDPIHSGHLIAAELARSEVGLDEVWFMPSYHPPHKEQISIHSWDHRSKMVSLAIAGHPFFRLLPIEHEREGLSYTFDTIIALKNKYPTHHFYFILGTDMIVDLPNWYKTEELRQLVSFIGLKRPGYTIEVETVHDISLFPIQWISMIEVVISSTLTVVT
ncbi:MAG: nicotinate-nucleotide adenylyltransferase, partial [Bacilli bacterium]